MITTLQAIRQLLGYLLIATLLLSPVGWYLIYLAFFINRHGYEYYIWLILDRLACSICHKTTKRTISELSGEMAYKGIKRYKKQAKLIDFLAYKLAGQSNHCYSAYQWEKSQGFIN